MLPSFSESVVQLIVRTSTDLPPDVRAAMGLALENEISGTQAAQALGMRALVFTTVDRLRDDLVAAGFDSQLPLP